MGIRLIAACLAFWLGGCASVLTVKSDPLQADISFQDSKTGDKKPLGKTPLEMPMATFREIVGETAASGQVFTLIVEKPGYITEKFQVPASRFGTLVTALEVKLKQGNGPKEERLAKEILDHLFLAQKMAMSRQFERAQIELDKILTDVPTFPRALSMRASIYYMQKNYPESLKWYEEALRADPQMEDAIQMSVKIRQLQRGGRAIAGQTAPVPTASGQVGGQAGAPPSSLPKDVKGAAKP